MRLSPPDREFDAQPSRGATVNDSGQAANILVLLPLNGIIWQLSLEWTVTLCGWEGDRRSGVDWLFGTPTYHLTAYKEWFAPRLRCCEKKHGNVYLYILHVRKVTFLFRNSDAVFLDMGSKMFFSSSRYIHENR